jgi:hypothetical protein
MEIAPQVELTAMAALVVLHLLVEMVALELSATDLPL